MDPILNKKLSDGAESVGVTITEKQIRQFMMYLSMLLDWNEKVNLTAITDPEEIVVKHFIDSISLIAYLEKNRSLRLLDVGTGAGFPGIPLKIVRPELNVVLLDSLNKRVNFLNDCIKELGLSEITALHGRAEDFGRTKGYREEFDIVTSRAVAKLSVLAELCIPFLKPGGIFASYKGAKAAEEISEAENALKTLGGQISKEEEVTLPGLEDKRVIILIKKRFPTPDKYPRKAGMPEKKPL